MHSPLTNRLTTNERATLPTSFADPDPPTGVSNPNSFDSNDPDLILQISLLAFLMNEKGEQTLFGADTVLIDSSRRGHSSDEPAWSDLIDSNTERQEIMGEKRSHMENCGF